MVKVWTANVAEKLARPPFERNSGDVSRATNRNPGPAFNGRVTIIAAIKTPARSAANEAASKIAPVNKVLMAKLEKKSKKSKRGSFHMDMLQYALSGGS